MSTLKSILILFLLFLSHLTIAQNIELGKTTIRLDEEFTITLTFPRENKKEYKSFPFPEIQNFVKVRTRLEEDKKSNTFKIIQSYSPLIHGNFKVPSFKVVIENQVIASPSVNLTVIGGNTKKPTTETDVADAEFKSENQEIYFSVSSDKKSVYVGEEFTIYAAILIGENNKVGFNLFDLNEQILGISRGLGTSTCLIDENSQGMIEQLRFDTIQIKNKVYKRLKLFEAKAYPINSEKIRFPALNFKILKYLTAKYKNDILWKAEVLKMVSKPLIIQVKELPDHPQKENAPIGSFYIKEELSNGKIKTGKSFKYSVTFSGAGNLSMIMSPEAPENDLFDFYAPVIKQFSVAKDGITTDLKKFTYNIIPKEPGNYKLSDYFQWVYFDPLKNQYDTLRSSIKIKISGESQKNRAVSSTDLDSFYELAKGESNKLRSRAKDQSIKFFANIIILFMLVTTAVLIMRR